MANKTSNWIALILGLLSVVFVPFLMIAKIEEALGAEAEMTIAKFILCGTSFLSVGLFLCFLIWLAFGFLKEPTTERNEKKECNFPKEVG